MKRVAVVGMGIVSPLGCSTNKAFSKMLEYKNCVKHLQELEEYKNLNAKIAAPVLDFNLPEHFTRKVTRTMGKVSLYAAASAEDALKDAGLLGDEIITNGKTGVSYGSSSGSLETIIDFYSMEMEKEIKRINSGSYIKMMSQTTSVNLSLHFKTTGRLIPSSSACTSGSMGIGFAYEAIKNGHQTVMIAGGAEELHATQIAIFDTLYATSTKNDSPNLTPKPFDKERDGLVIGEGAGTLILEEYEHAKKRGAKIYAEIIGFATNSDGTHITNPNKETMAIVMKNAINSAKINPKDIGYINAHGTATLQGDVAESLATEEVFKGCNTPVSTIKSYTGHTLGACGAIEAVLSIEMMNKGWLCPTINLENPDENCGKLNYIKGKGIEAAPNIIMSNNFAFGGINTSLIFKKV